MDEKRTDVIFPVILKVPDETRALTGKDRVAFLKQYARQAVALSARKSGMDLPGFDKDAHGVPVATNGVFWSLSHKPGYVAGVTASCRIGIDVERIRPVRPSLFDKIIDQNERRLADAPRDEFFCRCWTAKEAVLKTVGVGLAGLSRCKILHIPNQRTLTVSYGSKQWMIQHIRYDQHVISVVTTDHQACWVLPDRGNCSQTRQPLTIER